MTPTCENCGAKFPGDPCKKCGKTPDEAKVAVQERRKGKMPSDTRRRRKHGRPR